MIKKLPLWLLFTPNTCNIKPWIYTKQNTQLRYINSESLTYGYRSFLASISSITAVINCQSLRDHIISSTMLSSLILPYLIVNLRRSSAYCWQWKITCSVVSATSHAKHSSLVQSWISTSGMVHDRLGTRSCES